MSSSGMVSTGPQVQCHHEWWKSCADGVSKVNGRHPHPPRPQQDQNFADRGNDVSSYGMCLWNTSESQDSKSLVGRVASLREEASLGVLSSRNHTGGVITAQGWDPRRNLPLEGASGGDPAGHVRGVRGRSDHTKSWWDKAETGDTITSDGPPEQAVSLVMTSQHWGRASGRSGGPHCKQPIDHLNVTSGETFPDGAACPVMTSFR